MNVGGPTTQLQRCRWRGPRLKLENYQQSVINTELNHLKTASSNNFNYGQTTCPHRRALEDAAPPR